jgi:hypothetical protein
MMAAALRLIILSKQTKNTVAVSRYIGEPHCQTRSVKAKEHRWHPTHNPAESFATVQSFENSCNLSLLYNKYH